MRTRQPLLRTMTVACSSLLSFLVIGSAAAAVTAPHGQPEYSVIDLGSLGDSDSEATAISGSGLVVGTSFTRRNDGSRQQHAFLWQEGVGMTDLGSPPRFPFWSPSGVNDDGWVVGTTRGPNPWAGVLFRGGDWLILALGRYGAATSVNNQGQVVLRNHCGRTPCAILYEDGDFTDLGALPGDHSSLGTAINGSGQVVGGSSGSRGRSFLWQRDTGMVELALPVQSSSASAISENGLVAGSFSADGVQYRPYFYRDGEMLDLGTMPGDDRAAALGVNSLGQVVGWSGSRSDPRHAFLWQEDLGMVDLNELIPANSGWELISAAATNDAGQIVGRGKIGAATHAFLLRPVGPPEKVRRR